MKFRITLFIVIIITSINPAFGSESHELKFGVGVDALNFLQGGYSLRASLVFDQIEFDVGIGRNDVPDWWLLEGVDGAVVKSASIVMKYNLGKNVTNLFLGLGCQYGITVTDYSTTDKNVRFENLFLAGFLGYNFRLSDHFRLIPAIGAGFIVGGEKEKIVDGLTYSLESDAYGGMLGIYYYF